jgi:hypothetical protein
VEAAAISANLAVSVTVLDECVLHSLNRSATCNGGSLYAVGVARETRETVRSDQLTMNGEHVQTSVDGARVYTTSQGFAVTQAHHDVASASSDVRPVQQSLAPQQLVRVTYSF